MNKLIRLGCALAAAGWMGLAAHGAEAIKNADCLDCHNDREMVGTNAAGRVRSLFVDPGAYTNFAHADQACVDCHADIKELPHPERLRPADCGSCHEDAAKAYRLSAHSRSSTTGRVEAATCADCHGPAHAVIPSARTNSPTHSGHIAATCGSCHAQPEIMAKYLPHQQGAVVNYEASVHGLTAHRQGRHGAVCTDCHGAHDILAGNQPASRMYWQNIPATCGQCHGEIATNFLRSVHGKAALAGRRDSPICTDCHGEHTIAAVTNVISRVSPAHIPDTCGQCHGAERIATRYTLTNSVVDTYMQSFHGLAAQIGGVSAANCASCHGYHDILPSSDPASSINPANLPVTCGKCHQGLGTRLASGELRIHLPPGAASGKSPIVNIVSRVYIALILFVIGGMLVYVLLDYAAKARAHVRRVRAATDAELRFTPVMRLQHALMVILFILLAYTGFVHKFPDAFWSWPFRAIPDGSYVRGLIHRIAGWGFTLLFLVHLAALLLSPRGHAYLLELRLMLHDPVDAWARFRRNVGLGGAYPPPRRFNFAEKAEYWALVWGSVVMIITGIMLIFTNAVLRLFSGVWLELAQVVHYYESVLATLAIVVWHFYWVIFDPDEYPMNTAWIIGTKAKPHTPEPEKDDKLKTTNKHE